MGAAPGKPTNDPNNYFAFGKQTAKGTDASTFFFTRHLDGSGYDVDSEVESVREGGDGQEVGLRYRTMVKADPQLVSLSRQQVAARLWAGVLGVDTIASAGVPSLARHTAAPAASLPYFTVEQRNGDLIERVSDAVWTSLTVEGEAGKPWRLTAAGVGGGTVSIRDAGSTLTPSRETGRPAFYPGGSYTFDAGASYATDVTKWKVEVNRNVDDAIQTTGISRDDVVPLNFDVSVDATIKYTSRDFYKKVQFTGGSVPLSELATGSLDLAQIVQAGTMAASALSRIVVPLLEWTDAKVNKLDPDGKTVYLDVVGQSLKGHASGAIYAVNDNQEIAAY
jgi:hypothetical protein